MVVPLLVSKHPQLRIDAKRVVQGAAKLVSLLTVSAVQRTQVENGTDIDLKAISPKVLMVEEAGQVLEAHILSSLVPSGMSTTF